MSQEEVMDISPVEITSAKRALSTEGESDNRQPPPKNQKKIRKPPSKEAKEHEAASTSSEIVTGTQSKDLPVKYGAFTKAPYVLHFRLPSSKTDKEKTRKRTSLLKVSKMLANANVKFLNLRNYSFDMWVATFPTKTAANAVLSNKYIKDAGFAVFIPAYKLTRKMVIRNIPIEFSLEEIKKAIEEENSDIMIHNIFRLKKKDRTTALWTDSENICVQKMGEDIPESLLIMRTINTVTPYISSVRLCYKCGYFGHISKYCERNPRCLQCGESDHQSSKDQPCQKEKKCINCSGSHSTTDRECPLYVRNAEIARVMAYDNLFEAKTLVIRQEKKTPVITPPKTIKNFPLLPQKKGVSLVDNPAMFQSSVKSDRLWTQLFTHCAAEVKARAYRLLDWLLELEEIDDLFDRMEKTLENHKIVVEHTKQKRLG
ncbi:uncharacterized protein LOC118648143 [Monomorium pharaonis]|uniref:uncharacterized protein LOC118646830 n=1 Tax=Monomorium pharaonis TaxID=307658 RepID=UPI001746F75C|nr:uncharacterized protein LOC118646830 [Monomorium pharaonis]XP_036150320.1 uncharacterized protein LOC118648143 [Monomorium pharaonis]